MQSVAMKKPVLIIMLIRIPSTLLKCPTQSMFSVSKCIIYSFLKWKRQTVPNLCVIASSPDKPVAVLKKKKKKRKKK